MRSLHYIILFAAAAALFTGITAGVAYGNNDLPQAICVPWPSKEPQYIYHNTYDGAEITLKGIARGAATEFRWDFGDGDGTAWTPISDPYDLGVKHIYTGIAGQIFVATLHVTDGSGNEDKDLYNVRIYESSDLENEMHLNVRINMAIDEGLWWLHKTMKRGTYGSGSPGYSQPYGYWNDPGGYPLPAAGTAVGAFQQSGHKLNMDYDGNPYVETVQRGINYLLHNTYAFSIGPQAAGDPDADPDKNGIGLVTNHSSSPTDSYQTYIGGICMITLASCGADNTPTLLGRDWVYNRTYKQIVQDMVDFFAWGQVEASSGWYGRGGWRYYGNYNGSDMSTTQWPALGIWAAEYEMQCEVPDFVRSELELYLNAMQNFSAGYYHGGFRYNYSSTHYNNAKTGAGIICHMFLGSLLDDPRVEAAIGFIYRHWNDTVTNDWTNQKLHGHSYSMYGVMKGFRMWDPDVMLVTEYDYNNNQQTGNTFNWYYTPAGQTNHQGLATYNVLSQQSNGSWDDYSSNTNPVFDAFCTGWRILTLLPGVTDLTPVAVIKNCDELAFEVNQTFTLDGSPSYHLDPSRDLVKHEWDLDDDGLFGKDDDPDDPEGEIITVFGGFPEIKDYPVSLRVWDNSPEPISDTTTCIVEIHPPPHPPVADAGGPYYGIPGETIPLDGSGSYDPNGDIVKYEWDTDNDGLFGDDDTPPDPGGMMVDWIWNSVYHGSVGLRVTDSGGWQDTDYAPVSIDENHPPVADPNGPYFVWPGETITLDGNGSYDNDPGDHIDAFAWEINEDNKFDDGFQSTCKFTAGNTPGQEYLIALKVWDKHGEYDIGYTFVRVRHPLPHAVFSPRGHTCIPFPSSISMQDPDCGILNGMTGEIGFFMDGQECGLRTLDAVDLIEECKPETSATMVFSVCKNRIVWDPVKKKTILLKACDVCAMDMGTGAFEVLFDGSKLPLKRIDAVSILDNGRIVFSPDSHFAFYAPPDYKFISLGDEDLGVYDPATGAIEVFLRGKEIGIKTLDGVDVYGEKIYFSVRKHAAFYNQGKLIVMEDRHIGVYDVFTGEVKRYCDFVPTYLKEVDALCMIHPAEPGDDGGDQTLLMTK